MKNRTFEIDFDGNLKAMININNGIPFVTAAVNDIGENIDVNDVSVYEHPSAQSEIPRSAEIHIDTLEFNDIVNRTKPFFRISDSYAVETGDKIVLKEVDANIHPTGKEQTIVVTYIEESIERGLDIVGFHIHETITEICEGKVAAFPKVHNLKILPTFFNAVMNGQKTYEVRKNDRDFKTGDVISLMEYEPSNGLTGFNKQVRVTHILTGDAAATFGIKEGYVVLGIRMIED